MFTEIIYNHGLRQRVVCETVRFVSHWSYCENHCVKRVQIRSHFWSVFSCIRTEYRIIRTRNNSVSGRFSRSEFFHSMILCSVGNDYFERSKLWDFMANFFCHVSWGSLRTNIKERNSPFFLWHYVPNFYSNSQSHMLLFHTCHLLVCHFGITCHLKTFIAWITKEISFQKKVFQNSRGLLSISYID